MILGVAAAVFIAAAASLSETSFTLDQSAEVVATLHAGCERCDWGVAGREGASVTIAVDGRYRAHVMLTRGEDDAEYRVLLGRYGRGKHTVTVASDPSASAPGVGAVHVSRVDVASIGEHDPSYDALAHAPILHARPNTIGHFTDVPLLMWYETGPTPRGRSYRYSVIFSNEDGGTATDRLMATWGRTTDIEFVYGVEVGGDGRVLAEEFQGPGHEVPPFRGRHEARHPLLWVSTDNNMVSESGPTRVRYAPAPERFDLHDVSREAVMDANPWTYAVASLEMRREGKIVDEAAPGNNTIPDPRRFVYVEACGQVGSAALAFAIRLSGVRLQPEQIGTVRFPPSLKLRRTAVALAEAGQPDGDGWIPSDRGLRQYRIVRDGCFRAAIPLPAGTRAHDVRALRVQAFERPAADGVPPAPPGPVRLTRINKVFMLDEQFVPGASMLKWEGSESIPAGGSPFEVRIP